MYKTQQPVRSLRMRPNVLFATGYGMSTGGGKMDNGQFATYVMNTAAPNVFQKTEIFLMTSAAPNVLLKYFEQFEHVCFTSICKAFISYTS